MNRCHPLSALVVGVLLISAVYAASPDTNTRARMSVDFVNEAPEIPVAPEAKPYVRRSLADASDAEVLRLMGPGKNAEDFEKSLVVRNRLPDDFWTMKPREAALAFAEINRSQKHQARFKLEIDATTGDAPPEVGTLTYSEQSARCYNAWDWNYFVKVDPSGSYLAYGASREGGVVFYSVVFDQPGFDLKYCPLSYEDARHIFAVIWWLNRVRSRYTDPKFLGGGMLTYSSGDGSASVALRDGEGVAVVEHNAKTWAGSQIAERWTAKYDPEVKVNLIDFLVAKALPERLGDSWKQSSYPANRSMTLGVDRGPLYTDEQLRHVTALTQRFLGLYSQKQDKLSNALIASAANAAGTLALSETKGALEKIRAANPTVNLADVISTSLVKLEVASDPAALHEWAASKTPGSQWAMQRLSSVDQARYLQALEWWVGNAEAYNARQFLAEIRRINPARAAEISSRLVLAKNETIAAAPGAGEEVSTAKKKTVISALDRAKEIEDDQQRITALIRVLLTPENGWEDRWAAITLLVPPDDPLIYPQREIDVALLRALDPDQADVGVSLGMTVSFACQALGSRKQTEAFDRISQVFVSGSLGALPNDQVLEALLRLAQADPEKLKPKLSALLKPQFNATNKQMNQLLLAAWTLDLREFLPVMEKLATADPVDFEDRSVTTRGGSVKPVTGRFHQARKIADLWNASDPVTEIRLLTAFAASTSNRVNSLTANEGTTVLGSTLRRASASLTTTQRQRLDEFFAFVEALPEDDSYRPKQYREKLVALVKAEIAVR